MAIGITLLNGKGGAGKSTIAIILADYFAAIEKRVLIIDTDPRQNVAAWWADCKKNGMQRSGISIANCQTAADLKAAQAKIADKFDLVIYDTAGIDTTVPATCIVNSNILISPVQVAKREIVGVYDANILLKKLIAENLLPNTIPHYVIPTRTGLTSKHTEIYKTMNDFVKKLGAERSAVDLAERNFYKELQNGMSTIVDYIPEKASQRDGHKRMLIECGTLALEVGRLASPEGENFAEPIIAMLKERGVDLIK